MTLGEFLLARIAEDEATFRWGRLVADLNDPGYEILRWDDERGRAECEAKRRIVATCRAFEYEVTNVYGYDDILGALALPYADHADYREEWRA